MDNEDAKKRLQHAIDTSFAQAGIAFHRPGEESQVVCIQAVEELVADRGSNKCAKCGAQIFLQGRICFACGARVHSDLPPLASAFNFESSVACRRFLQSLNSPREQASTTQIEHLSRTDLTKENGIAHAAMHSLMSRMSDLSFMLADHIVVPGMEVHT